MRLVAACTLLCAAALQAGTYTVTSLADAGEGSLRWAIGQANANPGADTIEFAVAGTISPASALPALTDDGTTIDASGQWQGEWPEGEPGVRLNGAGAGTSAKGIVLAGASDCRVSGLAVTGFKSQGILVEGGAQRNVVGGIEVGWRNVVSGNSSNGIRIEDEGTEGNLIAGNYVGTTLAGKAAWGNTSSGVYLSSSVGPNEIRGNVIAANSFAGISSFADGQTFAGNIVGMDRDAENALGNGDEGIMVYGSNNRIGGPDPEDANIVAHNQEYGISFGSSANDNRVEGNSIHHNGDSGIHVYGQRNTITRTTFAANAETGIELRSGGNGGIARPTLGAAVLTGASLHVEGTGAGADGTVEIFAADTPASGQGRIYLGSLTADAGGVFAGDLDTGDAGLYGGCQATATTTSTAGNTSAFAAVRMIEAVGTRVTATSGAWTAGATWVGGVVPTDTESATIREGHTLAAPDGLACQDLRLLPGAALELAGSLPAATGVVDLAAGTVRYLGADGNQTVVAAVPYGDLVLGGTAPKTIDGPLVVARDLDLLDTAQVAAQGTIQVGGDLAVADQAALTLGGDTGVGGGVLVGLDATLVGGTHAITVGGHWHTPGNWQHDTSRVAFAGSAPQSIGPAPSAGGDAQVGDQATSIDGNYPFDNYYKNNRSQLLYLGGDIGVSGALVAIQFQLSQTPSDETDRHLQNFQIRMRQTADANWSGRTSFVDMAESTVVFSASPYTMPGTTGWFEIQLDTPFVFDISANLVVEIQWGANADWVYSTQRCEVLGTARAYTGALYGRNDSETPANYDGKSAVLPNAFFTFAAGGTAPEFHHLDIGNPAAPVTAATDLRVHGDLAVAEGAELAMGTNTLAVGGAASLVGPVSYAASGDVPAGAATPFPAGGMDLLTMGGEGAAPGLTQARACTGVTCPAGAFGSTCRAAPDTVKRYFDIAPANPVAATVRFHYLESERNGLVHGASLRPFHWNGTASRWETAGTYAGHGGAGTAADPYYVEYGGIASFSPFVLATSSPDGMVNAPSGLVANPTSPANVDVQWVDNSFDETGFQLERRDGDGPWNVLATLGPGVVFHADATAIEGVRHTYRVQALRDGDSSAYSNEAEAAMPLLAPENLTATAAGHDCIELAWTNHSSHADAYEIRRRQGDGTEKLLATLPAASATYADTGLTERITCTYRVRAVSAVGVSAYSNEAAATTGLVAPTGLFARVTGAAAVVLYWNDNSIAESGYRIERREEGGVYAPVHTTGAGAIAWTDADVLAGVTYFYRIMALDPDGQSEYSNEASVIVRDPRAFFVRPDGGGDGSSWFEAMDMLDAVLAANVDGDTMHIGEGTYGGAFFVVAAIQVLGGYPDTLLGTDTEGRDPAGHESIIDATGTGVRALTLRGSATVDGLTLTGGDGGLRLVASTPTVRNCRIVGNHATSWHGGGIRIDGGTPQVENNEIANNVTDYSGGGIWLVGADARIVSNRIHHNLAQDDGGGISSRRSAADADTQIRDNSITDNEAVSRLGGGIELSGKCLIVGNDVSHNIGIGIWGGTPTVEDNTVLGNTSSGLAIDSGTIRRNVISANGGRGITGTIGGTSATIDANLISHNQMGGISVGEATRTYATPYARITNNIIVGNHTLQEGGGVSIYYNLGEVRLTNNTIVGNTSDDGHHGVWICCFGGATHTGYRFLLDGFRVTLRNCIVRGNGTARSQEDVYVHASGWYTSEPVHLEHCNVGVVANLQQSRPDDYLGAEPPVHERTNCIDADSQFMAAADHHIAAGSPCVNAGTPDGAPDHDYDGDPRPWDGGVDIGADEACRRVHNITADTWHPTIGEALGLASDNDEIEVYSGTYVGNLSIGFPVTLRSVSGWGSTVIEPDDPATHAVLLHGTGTVLQGFTIQHADGAAAAGVAVVGATAVGNTVRECFLMANTVGVLVGEGASGTILAASTVAHNNGDGVRLADTTQATIGGDNPEDGNAIYDNGGHGVRVDGAGATLNELLHNRIGIQADGTASGNDGDGVRIEEGASENCVGTTGRGNLIAANGGAGVAIRGAETKLNVLLDNTVGLAPDGVSALPNAGGGVDLREGTRQNQVGQTDAGNTIAGNTLFNLRLAGGGTTGNALEGNRIGTTADGTAAPDGGNPACGILLEDGAAANEIGGDAEAKGNTVSGHGECGIRIAGTGTTTNRLRMNRIGLDSVGSSPLPNAAYGIELRGGASANLIGESGFGNTVSGNPLGGIRITGAGTEGNILAGNVVGLAKDGLTLPDGAVQAAGVLIEGGATANVIGGDNVCANVIAGNTASGIRIEGATTVGNFVAGNRIGTDKDDLFALPNGTHGILLCGGARDNWIGAMPDGERGTTIRGNRIRANTQDGILAEGAGTTGNRIVGNEIGGGVGMGNGRHGISLVGGASANMVGGEGQGEGNLVGGNAECGIRIEGAGTDGNLLRGNRTGCDWEGEEALANGAHGIWIGGGAQGNAIGGTAAAMANVVSGNAGSGIVLSGTGTTGNTVQGNRVGTTRDGLSALPNAANGILVEAGATANRVGSATSGGGNVIAGNRACGVRIEGGGTAGNRVQGNRIGLSPADTGVPNQIWGILLAGGAVGNTVGGDRSVGEGNVVSANAVGGIRIEGEGTDNNLVGGNWVGPDSTGRAVPAGAPQPTGVQIAAGAARNLVGDGATTGNVVSGNTACGIRVEGAGTDWNEVVANRVGTDGDGTSALPNGGAGIEVADGAADNVVGTAGLGNLVSGNDGAGILLAVAPRTAVVGNTVGLDAAGTGRLGNGGDGIAAAESASVVLAGNTVAANQGDGIALEGAGTTAAEVAGNILGTNAAGAPALGNGGDGLRIAGGATGATVGPDNRIAANVRHGIAVAGPATMGHVLTRNRIHDNGGDGIALLDGGNQGVAVPGLTAAWLADGQAKIVGALPYAAENVVEIFAADGAASGEGEIYLGAAACGADGTFALTVPAGSLALGDPVTATARYAGGDTSPFAGTVPLQEATPTETTVLNWAAPAPIVYGTPLGDAQLAATANTPGRFEYTPPAGTVLDAGAGQELRVEFVPDDPFAWTSETLAATIDVGRAPLTCTAEDKAKVVGSTNPVFTLAYAGLVNGDSAPATPPDIGCTADETSGPGTYAITLAGGDDPNYELAREDGELTVHHGITLRIWVDEGGRREAMLLQFGEAAEGAPFDLLDEAASATAPHLSRPAEGGANCLLRDFRPVAATTRWRLVLPPDGDRATITLTWDIAAADDGGREIYLQELRDEETVGFPVDMRNETTREAASGSEFEIVYAIPAEIVLSLEAGWNLVGSPLMSTQSAGEILDGGRDATGAGPLWWWRNLRYCASARDDALPPERGHWLHCRTAGATAPIAGIRADGTILLHPGWNIVTPAVGGELPEVPGVAGTVWQWDPPSHGYLAVEGRATLEVGKGYWIYNDTEETVPMHLGE